MTFVDLWNAKLDDVISLCVLFICLQLGAARSRCFSFPDVENPDPSQLGHQTTVADVYTDNDMELAEITSKDDQTFIDQDACKL